MKLNCSGQYVYKRTRRHILFWQETLFNAHLSEATLLVVYWPNHGPRVDVEQGASRARGTLTVAHAQRIARFLAAVHVPGNGAVVSGWKQGHFPQDVRKGYDIQDRIGLREIQKLCANLSCAGPPRFGVCRWAVVIQILVQQSTVSSLSVHVRTYTYIILTYTLHHHKNRT